MIKIELDEQKAWALTEILSQFIDGIQSNDEDLRSDGQKLYEIILEARSK